MKFIRKLKDKGVQVTFWIDQCHMNKEKVRKREREEKTSVRNDSVYASAQIDSHVIHSFLALSTTTVAVRQDVASDEISDLHKGFLCVQCHIDNSCCFFINCMLTNTVCFDQGASIY